MRTQSFLSRQALIYCLMTAALCWTAYLNLLSPYTTIILGMSPAGADNPLAGIDAYIRQATANGNAVVIFHGFAADQGKDGVFIRRIYFRGNYSAYPHRIFVCDDATVFDPDRLAVHPFAPSATWLKEHAVHSILTFTAAPGKDLQFTVSRI